MYASVDTALPFAVSLIACFIVWGLVDAILYLFSPLAKGGKQTASAQFVIACLDFLTNFVSCVFYTSVSILSSLAGGLIWASALVAVGSLLYLIYEEFPWVWTDLARSYNAFLGPFIQNTLIRVLDITNVVFRGVIPLWNAVIFFFSRLLNGYTLPAIIEEMPVIRDLGLAIFDLFKHLIFSFFNFIQPILTNCPDTQGDVCFAVENRTLDLMTPMADTRLAVSHFVVLAKGVCGYASPVLDAVSFPFMDINFASAVHNLVNSILYLFVSVSKVTYLRCTRHGGEEPLMCTPDLEPVFMFFAAGMRSLGSLLDNWLNVLYVILQGVLGWSHISCTPELLPTSLDPGPIRTSLFGSNRTALVGLTGNLIGITDGSVVAYEGKGHLRMSSWPEPVNISYGVAAVTYGRSSDADVSRLSAAISGTSTSLFGCICVRDPDVGLQIQCSVLPYGGLLDSETGRVPVFFQQGSIVQKTLHCSEIDITIQSVRWPATRFASPSGGGGYTTKGSVDCVTSQSCNKVDATVWLTPRVGCDSESTSCDCFPYCMAARVAGSQTAPLVFYSAEQWKSKVFLVARDCILNSLSSGLKEEVSGSVASAGVTTVQVNQASSSGGVQFVSGKDDNTITCVDNLLVTTLVNRSLHPAYDTPTPAYLRNSLAPFAITGDTVLTSVLHGDGAYTVRVERITGAAGHEFTLSVVSNNFPAAPPPTVPAALFKQYPKDHLTIPYSRLSTVAVSSRDYVFYAVNPATEVFDAYLHYCRNNGERIDQFGLIMLSSYSPIRVWRVDAYRRCGVQGCGSDLVKQVDIPGAFSDGTISGTNLEYDCARSFNEAIVQLEYINEINIAITVRRTNVKGTLLEYQTYWLHVRTMQLRGPGLDAQGPWEDTIPVTALSAYSLCPAMQILPPFGSLVTELVLAAVFLVKMPLDTVLYLPGIVNMWGKGTVCPLVTRGHTVMQQCGAHAFSLEDFFSSLQTATNLFWSSLTYLSLAVGQLGSAGLIENGLNGLAKYGAGSIDLWTVRFQVLTLMKAGPSSVLESLPINAIVSAKGGAQWAQGPLKVSSNVLGWARFGYATLCKIIVVITQNVAMNKKVSASGVWRIIVNALDEMRDYYDSFVVDNMRQSCAGLSLMLGIDSPWAVFLYQQCIAATTVIESGLTVTLSVFNLAPFAQCMCSGSAGHVFGDYARMNCVPQASTTLKPVLLDMIQASSRVSGSDALCQSMLSYTRTQLVSSMQPWFDAQDASLNALASSIDYILFWIDPKAGKCLDFNNDPDVVVLMPYPVDYFQACGKTSICRARCFEVFEAFEASRAAASVTSSSSLITVKTESLFFPVISIDAFTPMHIRAIIQPLPSVCQRVCGVEGDSCVAVSGVYDGLVVVQHYCTPKLVTSSVFRTVDKSVEWVVAASKDWWNNVIQIQFCDAESKFMVILLDTGDLYMASASDCILLTSLSLQTDDIMMPALRIPSFMSVYRAPYMCVSINVMYRMMNGQITGQLLHRKLVVDMSKFPIVTDRWKDLGASQFFVQLQNYAASQIQSTTFDSTDGARFLLLPLLDGLPVSMWTLVWDTNDVTNGLISWSVETLPTPPGVGGLLNSGQALSTNCVMDEEGAFVAFAGVPEYQSTEWLSQLRISGVSANSYRSQEVPIQVQTIYDCSINSCLGCPDGEVQRLCDAAQQCAVIKCVGTPINMRRVLCQVGQVIADDTRESLALLHGTWVIFVDMFMALMDLSLQKGLTGLTLTWPDDRFFGYICTIKDNNAHMISVLTSALNSVVQMGHSAVMYLQGGAHQIDSNFNALSTMPLTALTNMVHQVMLGPLYPFIVAQQVLMCRANGVLAIFDVTGYTVRVGDAGMQDASASLVGQCLTQNFVSRNNNPKDATNTMATSGIVTQVVQSTALALLPELTFKGLTIETAKMAIDGKISYWMGVLYGISDVLQSLDMAHCKLPDYSLNDTVFCACGDTQYVIPETRRREGLAGVGLWCTGTLTLLDAVNQPFVIYNPYSYSELQSMAYRSDAYLSCMSGKSYGISGDLPDCHSLLPTAPDLELQGVSVLTVLTACRNNYMHKQWDRGAHVLFNRTLFDSQISRRIEYPATAITGPMLMSVGNCLADETTRSACLQNFLVRLGKSPDTYWMYEDSLPGPSQTVDACSVFSGPASNQALTDSQRSVFRACLDDFSDSNCQLSSTLWTPQSDNAVPVALRHSVRLSGNSSIQSIVQLKYEEANALVMAALLPLQDYDNTDALTIFFSPEGDIMHQLMDCVFMGPYSRVDYWPVDSHRILSVPTWYRDSNGTSRHLDTRRCVQDSPDKSPPYSCGSQSRQAVIKYFFRDYLPKQQDATLKNIIGGLVNDLRSEWSNISSYSCLCAGNPPIHSVACCGLNSSEEGVGGWLPPGLTTAYQTVPANHILRALTTQVQEFYRYALEEPTVWTKYLDENTLETYDWTKASRAAVAAQEALFHTHKPLINYSDLEVNSPMLSTGLWEQCHGLLSQIFFTIPMQNTTNGQFIPPEYPTEGLNGVAGLNAFVRSAVRAAHTHSPIYRHYNVSYVPSDSRMCQPHTPVDSTFVASPPTKTISVSTFKVSGSTLMDTSSWTTLPSFGVDAFPLHGCFCGWDGDGNTCRPPAIVCLAVPSVCPTFPGASTSALELLKAKWSNDWPCPALIIADQAGVMGADETDEWLTGNDKNYVLQGSDILRRGRGGLRVGNFETINGLTRQYVRPGDRILEPSNVTLPYCASDFTRIGGAELLDESFFKAFVSGLFPVGQGVYDSGATSYCLRYLVEYGMLEAMTVILESGSLSGQLLTTFSGSLSRQRKIADTWKTKCESQLSLLALCKNLDVYKPPVIQQRRVYQCPFMVGFRDSNDLYTTPGCLVHSGGFFYDPCNCPGFTCGPAKPLFTSFIEACRIPFDPRDMTLDTPLGGWRVSVSEGLNPSFAQRIFEAGDGTGNVPRGKSWHSSEGFMDENGLHCDLLTDWWPQDETLPVGYHATMPCLDSETGYRTFDSAFAVERSTAAGQYTVVKMVYQHDLTRDATRIDTHSGAGGVCRLSNLGMPFYQMNTMQICTRQLLGDGRLDPAIPVQQDGGGGDELYGVESCSMNSSEVPWHALLSRHDSALYSVGTVPNMPDTATDSTYPAENVYFGVGPKSQILADIAAEKTGWGEKCSDFEIKECTVSSDCPSDYYCLLPAGVCMSEDFTKLTHCYRHDMCPAGYMCSGVGECVQGHIVILNTLNGTMEVPVFSEQCDEVTSDSYKTDGSSPWEYVPDWLVGHGMCSNKNWYQYMLNYLRLQSNAKCTTDACSVNGKEDMVGISPTKWWTDSTAEPQLFAVKPTICDRDYEHMKGPTGLPMKGCSPKKTVIGNEISDAFNDKTAVEHVGLFRNYDDKQTILRKMPFVSLAKTGFLGYSQSDLTPGGSTTNVYNCEKYQNCYAFPFTVNGLERTRLVKKSSTAVATEYNNDDIFRCGVAAFYDSNTVKCKLDTLVVPLYTALCQTPSVMDKCSCRTPINDGVGCKPVIDAVRVRSVCDNILTEFQAGYAAIQLNTKNLQDLFNVFVQSDGSAASHVSGVECFEAIYNNTQITRVYGAQIPMAGVYYPFSFALYEVPFAWLYQCVRLGGLRVDPTSSQIRCQQFEQGKSLSKALEYPEGSSSFHFNVVKGGYRRSDIVQSISDFKQSYLSAFPDLSSVAEFTDECSKMGITECRMVPYCANIQEWIPNSKMDLKTRYFLAGAYQDVCGSTAKAYVLKDLQLSFEEFIDQRTVLRDYNMQKDWVDNTKLLQIEDVIKSALSGCASSSYDENSRWPLSFNFDFSMSDCMDFVTVLNQLAMNLVRNEYLYSNPDQAYMPSQNSALKTPISLSDTPQSDRECIFTDLADQIVYYQHDATPLPCPFVNGRCAATDCKEYPKVYFKGELGCRYPMQKNYTSLSALVQYVWRQLRGTFNETYRGMPRFTPSPPSSLPFFEDSDSYFNRWSYDITGVQRYMSNINPDTSKELMCVIASARDAINFTTCNDKNYDALAELAQFFRQQGAATVPQASQLKWKVSQAFLSRGALFAYANSTRADAQVLLKNLFNNNTRCGVNEEMFNRVCLVQKVGAAGTSIKPWVPWLSGEWNPYEFCDVKLMELSHGNQEVIWPYDLARCPECSNAAGEYRSTYMLDSQSPTCDSRQQSYVKAVNVDPEAPTNLCYIRMQNSDTSCTHIQGMVGGERGQTMLNHPTVPNVYGTTDFFDGMSAGIYPRSPFTLLSGRTAATGQYGYLSVPGDEIGVTALGLAIVQEPGGDPYLRVERLPLQPETGFMDHWDTQKVSDGWVQMLASAFDSENSRHAVEQQARMSTGWDCPMRRTAFYSQSVGGEFTPALPSPGRARRIFGHLTQMRSAHPTFVVARDGSALGSYTTANGFCFCPSNMSSSQQQCLIPLTNVVHNCSLKRTIDALKGSWVQSFTFTPNTVNGGDSTCRMQFDWPYVGGKLRDGTTHNGAYTRSSDLLKRKCHVLDRLKPFLYRYKPGSSIIKDTGNTLDTGGVCHTGRSAVLTNQATAKLTTTRCVKRSESDSEIDVSCEDGTTMTLSKERSTPLDSMLTAVSTKRARCSTCSAPPTFTNSKRETIRAESSFGIPFRFSASRAAALDLRQMVCGDDAARCDSLMNKTAWNSENFMHTLLTNPSALFLSGVVGSRIGREITPHTPDTAWDNDWVFCNTTSALQSGQCSGRIPESQWRENRFQTCYKAVRQLTRDSPDVMSSVDVCLTDSSLQALCLAVQKAQTLVREANCLASGSEECMLKPFVYLPSAWDVSNQAFVHQTVSRFYTRINPLTCPSTTEAVQKNNQIIGSKCAAKPITAMYLGLQACRNIVDVLAQVVFYLFNIVLNGFLLLFQSDKTALVAQIVYYWNSLVSVLHDLLTTLADIFFDMLFHMGALGQRIYNLVRSACGVANKAYIYWLDVWCGLLLDIAPMLMGALRQLTEYGEVASEIVNDALGVIFRFMAPKALASMQQLGYTKHFRDKRAEEMAREKQNVHDAVTQSKKEGRSNDDVKKSLKTTRSRRYMKRDDIALGVLQGLLVGAGLSAIQGMGAFGFLADVGNSIYEAIELKRLYDLYPDNWTLFDYASVYDALDLFEYFITTNDQCMAYRASGVRELFNCTFPPLASQDSFKGAMLVATRCWADAQRDVGTSNLLACTESDTCYKSLYDTTSVVCASCPDAGEGYSLYGCSPVTKMCTCSVPTTKPSSCTSNEQCQYATSTCILVAGLDYMSYGNQPCVECTKQVQCLIRDDSGVGQCGCVFQMQPVQQCTQQPGQVVEITTPNKVCGYLPNADLTQSMAVSHWDAIALTPCLYLTPANIYCVQVFQDTGVIAMAVGLRMASMTSTFQSRRLLSEGSVLPEGPFEVNHAESEYALPDTPAMHTLLMEDWNGTAAPCSALVSAYQMNARSLFPKTSPLGPLDTMELHKCAYWRQVGREAIKIFKLQSLSKSEGFLLSTDDFAAALSQRSVMIELLRNPSVFVFALGRMPLFKPFYASALTLRSLFVSLSLSANSTRWHGLPVHEMWHRAWEDIRKFGIRAMHEEANLSSMERWVEREVVETVSEFKSEQDNGQVYVNSSLGSSGGRKLLQTSQVQNIQFAESWLTGPFTWPPTYYTQLLTQECSIGSAIVQILKDILEVLVTFYYNSYPAPPVPPETLWENLPDITPYPESELHGQDNGGQPYEGLIAETYHWVWSFFGLKPAYVRGFFSNSKGQTNVFTVSTSMLKCDFSSVTYCTHRKKDLVMSIILLVIFYMMVAYIARLAGLPIIATLMIWGSMPLLMWYCYGMALTCGPMIPTCFLDDVIKALNTYLPNQATVPKELSIVDGCLDNPEYKSCFKSCGDKPLFFNGWRDTFSFAVCYLDIPSCRRLSDAVKSYDGSLSNALRIKANTLSTSGASLQGAMRLCFVVTFVNLIPVFVLFVLCITSAAYLLYLPCVIIPRFFSLALQSLAYTHASDGV